MRKLPENTPARPHRISKFDIMLRTEPHKCAQCHQIEGKMSKQYRPRQPEKSDLYRILLDHLETFPARYDYECDTERGYLRPEVRESPESFLECGVLRFGFARLKCGGCEREKLLALSCRRRGICPSYNGKRLSFWSEALLARKLPAVPYRHWVISLPKRMRKAFRFDGNPISQAVPGALLLEPESIPTRLGLPGSAGALPYQSECTPSGHPVNKYVTPS